jgi:hypothetical protein
MATNKSMKTIAFALFTVFALLGTARADLTIVQQVEGAGPAAQITMKLKGDKARIEATPQITSIYDGKTGEVLSILNDQKIVMRMTAAQAKAAASAVGMPVQKGKPDAAAAGGKLKVTPTGKKETINGYETEEYTAEGDGYKASYWVARNYPQSDEILKQLQTMSPDAFGAGAMATPDFRDFPGLPIRTNIAMGDMKIVSTITAVKLDPLPESDFTAPAGFQEMKMPNMSTMMSGKPDVPKAVKPAGSPKR